MMAQEQQLRDSTGAAKRSHPTSMVGAAAQRTYPKSKERLGGATPYPRSGAAALRSYPMPKLRAGGREELPHNQGKEQRLPFAGAPMKRYPTSKVRKT